MATNYKLKPFIFNLSDLNFIKAQVNFKPLFDAAGNAIFNWDGTGTVYDANHTAYANLGSAAANMAAYGTSYKSPTDLAGIRDVSGLNNNLLLVHNAWGSADQPFLRTVAPIFDNYLTPNATGFYGSKTFTATATGNTDYTKDATHVDQSVVDYTPRMISKTVTTGGATPLLDANGQVVHFYAAQYATDATYAALVDSVALGGLGLLEGAAIVTDYGILNQIGQHDIQDPTNDELFVGSVNPGIAPNNSFLAYFGQFFDHGLDFIGKGASGTKITIPLATDDPLYRAPGTNGPGDPGNTKITVSRADVSGFDANGNAEWVNHTSPYIDQSQTYGSDAQVTELLREWVSTDGGTTYHAGAHLFDGSTSVAWTNAYGETTQATLPTLNELRAHLAATGRDDITWADISNLRNRDASGHVIDSDPLTAGIQATGSGQALILDMNPHFDTSHFKPATVAALDAIGIHADSSGNYALGGPGSLADIINFRTFEPMTTNASQALNDLAYEVMLESVGDHYLAGDGRVNENIALTSIHHVFHEEHNYQVRNIQNAVLEQDARELSLTPPGSVYNHSVAHDWQVATATQDANGNYTYGVGGAIAWDEAKLFQAAKMTVEMEYQHAAVDQYARSITPDLPEFVGYNTGVNATVSLEYAQGAFRFGHSTMRETIDTLDPNGSITGRVTSIALEQAFLNPHLYSTTGAAGIAMGLTHQQMNEVDELLTPAMNQGLLGQPLDLAAINIARGRDIGLPTLNDFRAGVGLVRYVSWADFGQHMVHPESLVNFIAAYSFDGDVAKAAEIIGLENGSITEGTPAAPNFTYEQALTFLNGGDTGYNHIDTWLGGLAEAHVLGGLLGETFNLVFVDQINRLMDGDRFYYLYRLNNVQFGEDIINVQLKDIVERNTGLEHLNGSVFSYADQYYDLSQAVDPSHTTGSFKSDHAYADKLTANPTLGIYSTGGGSTAGNGALTSVGGISYIRDFRVENPHTDANNQGLNLDGTPNSGANSNEVIVGSDRADLLYALQGDDTVYGEGGNDIIYGGTGQDRLYGGDGNDIIHGEDGPDLIDGGAGDDMLYGESSASAMAGMDQIIGGDGNDVIYGGVGIDKLSGERGDDVIFGGQDTDAFTHGGDGNDYIDGQLDGDLLWGDGGDDLVVGGDNQDIVAGLDGDDILRPGNPSAAAIGNGPDEVLGGDGVTDAGNDGKGVGFDIIDLSDYIVSSTGANVDFASQNNPLVAIDTAAPFAWVGIEGLIGSRNNDTAVGDANNNWLIGGSGNDTLAGGLGNDVIIGDGIRLDSLIGTYANAYVSNVDGASHRATGFIQNNGLLGNAALGTAGFDKHFTEMLKSDIFKNLELGGSTIQTLNGVADTRQGDGGVAGTADTVAFTGNRVDYSVSQIDFVDAHGTHITAYKVTDNRDPLAVDANGVLIPTDGTDVVVGVERFQFADVTLTVSPATLDLHAFDLSNVRDEFSAVNFSNNNGSVNWVGAWAETGDGANAVNAGQILMTNSQLRFVGGVGANFDGASIQRAVNLTGAATATLSFDFDQRNIDVGETVTVQFAADGINFTNVNTITNNSGNNNGVGTTSVSLTGPFTANSVIRFVASSINNTNESVRIDNVNIAITKLVNDGTNNYSVTYTENAPAVAIASGPSITDDGTVIYAAKIVLTNAQAGDVLNRHDINGDGITGTTDNSVAGQITVNLTGAATFAQYQAAIQAVTFNSTSDNPSTVNRVIDVTVNDGLSNSNVATTTVAVIATNDPMIANNDNLITNYGNTTGFAVAKWAFLANDVDPDSAMDITAVSNANSLTATLAVDSITVTDTGTTRGGSFTYTGTSPDTANVTVAIDNIGSIDGGNGSDIIVGDGASSAFNGGQGNDIIFAGAGDDTITQSASNGGRDFIDGGANGVAGDRFVLSGNASAETFNIYTAAAANLAGLTGLNAATEIVITRNGVIVAELDNVEEITVNALDVTANNGNGVLESGSVLGGDNINVFGDFSTTSLNYSTITVNGGTGNDTVDITGLESAHRIVFNSNGGFDTVIGARTQDVVNMDDLLIGDDLNNYMIGGTGNDLIIGGGGDDTMEGDEGNDGYEVTAAGDVVIENAGEGIDTVWTGINYTLTDNVERLYLGAGDININGTGNALDNLIVGNGGNNLLIGGAGSDTMAGGAGNDGYEVTAAGDVVIENAGEGIDTVWTGINYTLTDNVERLYLGAGDININGTGNALDNLIVGNGGNNLLIGGAGSDTMAGGAGNDGYEVTAAGDVVIENAGEGIDTVWTGINYTLTDNVERLYLGAGDIDINGTGNVLDNLIVGNGGDNVLIGVAGGDTLTGGAGADAFTYNNASESGLGALSDVITDFTSGIDKLDFSGIDAISGSVGSTFSAIQLGAATTNSAVAGELYYYYDGANTIVEGTVDNIAGADFQVTLIGHQTFVAQDIVL